MILIGCWGKKLFGRGQQRGKNRKIGGANGAIKYEDAHTGLKDP